MLVRLSIVEMAPPADGSCKSGKISVVVIALDEGDHLRETVKNLENTLPPQSEILVVDDGSSDCCAEFLTKIGAEIRVVRSDHLGVAKARNLGALQTDGEYVVFADAHIGLPAGWWQPLLDLLDNTKIGAVAPAILDIEHLERKGCGLHLSTAELDADWLGVQGDEPHTVPIVPGCCLAMRRQTFNAIGGFDPALIMMGCVDNELALRFWLLGYELWAVPRVEVSHLFKKGPPKEDDWFGIIHNRLRTAFVHFGRERIIRVVEALQDYDAFPRALACVMESDISARRISLRSLRTHDAEWYFQKFDEKW